MGILTAADPDAEITVPLAQGDPAAIEVMYERYGGLAYGLALRMLGDRGRAEDVVQEVFLSVWRKPDRFDASRGNFRSWLLTMVRNRAIDSLRSQWRRQGNDVELEATVPDPVRGDPWPEVALSLERDVVRQGLESLPKEQRQAIELAHFGGFTHTEIAERLGLPLGTVKGRMRLGMEKLHSYLSARGVVGSQ